MSRLIAIPAAANRQPRSAYSRVQIIDVQGRPAEALEFFEDTTVGRAALLLVCIQLGPSQTQHVRRLLDAADRMNAKRY